MVRTRLLSIPELVTDATFDALIAEIGRRMDADRGYGRRVLSTHSGAGAQTISGRAELSRRSWVIRTRVVDAFALDCCARLFLGLGVLAFVDGSLDSVYASARSPDCWEWKPFTPDLKTMLRTLPSFTRRLRSTISGSTS